MKNKFNSLFYFNTLKYYFEQLLWNFKLNLTKHVKFDVKAEEYCSSTSVSEKLIFLICCRKLSFKSVHITSKL